MGVSVEAVLMSSALMYSSAKASASFRGRWVEEALHHLQGQDDVVPHGQVRDDAVALAVLGQIADALLHGVDGLGDLHRLAVHLHLAAGHAVRAEDGAHALAAARAQQAGKAVHLALGDAEVKGSERPSSSLPIILATSSTWGSFSISYSPTSSPLRSTVIRSLTS